MSNQIIGKIIKIGKTQEIASQKTGNVFYKRDLVLDATKHDLYTGERGFENFPSFEFTGQHCDELDNFQVGQIVIVSFDIQGNKYIDKQTNQERYFNSVRGYKIELKQLANHQQSVIPSEQDPEARAQAEQQFQQQSKADDLPF
jgi:single-strand DNA-binding protein